MNRSDNLISLSMSDSGLGAPTPSSSISAASNIGEDETRTGGAFHSSGDPFEAIAAGAPAVKNCDTDAQSGDTGTGMLIDWDDEIQVPYSQAILTLAEVDDTFGVFSQEALRSRQLPEIVASLRSDDDTASKLVRSFTSGRKSDPKVPKMEETSQAVLPSSSEPDNQNKAEKMKIVVDEPEVPLNQSKDDSFASCLSDQPTVIEEDDIGDLPSIQNGSGIGDVKMDLGRNLSTGSDSDFLDINNLSSFSLPDGSIDETEYLKNIHKEDMAASTSAIVKKIKLEMMQDEGKSDEVSIPTPRISDVEVHISDVTRPTLDSTTSTSRSRRSSVSSVASVSSVLTQCGARLRNRLSTASTINDYNMTMGSPIRTSYPFTKFMPTPNGRTPHNDRITRDRLSDSLLSPSASMMMSRFLVQTGESQISPSRVHPVRRSISIETLHVSHSPPRMRREPPKFSTPTAPRTRNRYSITFEGDPAPAPLERNATFVSSDVGNTVNPNGGSSGTSSLTKAELWKIPRLDRVSYSSTSSCGSSALASPSSSTFIKREREISLLSRQMLKVQINPPASTSTAASNGREGPMIGHHGVQPLRATAVVPPNTLSKVEEPSTSKMNPFRAKTKLNTTSTVTTSSGQRKFVPPIAASSPKLAPSPARQPTRPATNQITPSRSRYAVNARSSGYGQQNLNATFEAKEPLKSPNAVTTQPQPPPAQKATVKQAALPTKSLKGGLPSLGARTRPSTAAAPSKDGEKPSTRSGIQSGFLRRPTATSTATSVVSGNKENNARGLTRFGYPARPPPRQQ